ncbi:hypothetical protein Calkro_0378 [Caldicellulosiruptor kronotskyensis 2002]|uniref:Uncharacterized protein n=1 Tax=Caldicellulosiruptor kronotskyensis (strain DSM 18902 / VKM B-2412 / 2002) TaxID=632348 RepID=E4SDZ4_CALK2|nr:hypothetical protein Calkro_0378 [Caldicellulosiruptor kronotskyensis 2002]
MPSPNFFRGLKNGIIISVLLWAVIIVLLKILFLVCNIF